MEEIRSSSLVLDTWTPLGFLQHLVTQHLVTLEQHLTL